MKPGKRAKQKKTLLDLDALVAELKEHAEVSFDWKSPIHLRLTVDGLWTDLWPTTGRWYDFTSRSSGVDIEALSQLINSRIDFRPFTLTHVPLPPPEVIKPPKEPKPRKPSAWEEMEQRASAKQEAKHMHIDETFEPNQFTAEDAPPW